MSAMEYGGDNSPLVPGVIEAVCAVGRRERKCEGRRAWDLETKRCDAFPLEADRGVDVDGDGIAAQRA